MFLIVLEWLFIVITLVFLGTQVIWPIFVGQPLFPIFRLPNKLEEELNLLNEEETILDLEKQLATKRAALEARRTEMKS